MSVTNNLLASAIVVSADIEMQRLRAEIDGLKAELNVEKEARKILFCERGELKAEVERLKAELKIAESFHRVAIKERDAERLCNEQLKRTTVSTKYHDEIVAEAVKERVAETSRLRGALHEISLCSQNSTSSKDECGRIARIALGEAGKQPEWPEKEPICPVCNDTHTMPFGDGEAPCTYCPVPCEKCRAGAYCRTTPCDCDCHKRSEAGKKEPETCVWTELENGRLRGCNGNRFGNELGRSKFCPECGRKVEVRG